MKSVSEISDELIAFTQSDLLEAGIKLEKDTPLDSVGVDSYAIVEIVLFIERKYGFSFSDEELKPEIFETIHKLATIVHTHLNK